MSTRTPSDRTLMHDDALLRWRLDGAGPALVLLHGWALDLDCWEPMAAMLAQRHLVIRHDRRGFGLSGGKPDVHRNVGDLLAVLDAAGVHRAVLVGMSQGARLALHVALGHPSRVRALVMDGAPPLDDTSELPLTAYRALRAAGERASLRHELLQHPLMRLQTSAPAMHALLQAAVDRYSGDDLLQQVVRDGAPNLAALPMPVLVLNGERDTAIRLKAGLALAAAIGGARRITLPGAGHLALLDDPAAYAGAVAGFCAGLPP